jgi:peptidyl-prolyl cis-trans isomerase A (cyclophilin A)
MRRIDEVGVSLQTPVGIIEIVLHASQAPQSSSAFLRFVEDGSFATHGSFYRAVRAHDNDRGRPVIDVIQGGITSPPADLARVEHEATSRTGLRHRDGTISLARGPLGSATGAAFFICIGDHPALDAGGERIHDGEGFAAFGTVMRGMQTVRAIHRMPTSPDATQEYRRGQMLDPIVRITRVSRLTR